MTIQINYKNNGLKKVSSNLVLFVDEKFNINSVKKYISSTEYSYISDLLKNSDLKKQLLLFEINSKKKNHQTLNNKINIINLQKI